jgi:hypothetical protein
MVSILRKTIFTRIEPYFSIEDSPRPDIPLYLLTFDFSTF